MENHHYSTRVFSRLFPSSCRFNSVTDVVESSIITSNPKNINSIQSLSLTTKSKHSVTAKQSPSSNSGLFSTEDESSGAISKFSKISKINNEDEIDECFSSSSDSSLSPFRNINYPRSELGGFSERRDETTISEMGSSSEASTSSSVNSFDHVKKLNPNQSRVTLAEQFCRQTRETEHQFSNSSVSCPIKDEINRKNEKKERSSTNFSFFGSGKGKNEDLSVQSSNFCRKTGKICNKTWKTEQLSPKSSGFRRKNSESGKKSEIRRCPLFVGGNIEESYAVEKESRDPYLDFMESMVEMIIEKKISKSKDLEKLLLCFLTLNSSVYHRVILDVFSEVCEALVAS